jgi:hypothetical protein
VSGIVLNEQQINQADIKRKTIQIKRCAVNNMGTRMWYQILTTDGEMYQRWTLLMNPTDEVLFLAQPGDELEIEYIDDIVEDLINFTFESFTRKVIVHAKFTNKLLMG